MRRLLIFVGVMAGCAAPTAAPSAPPRSSPPPPPWAPAPPAPPPSAAPVAAAPKPTAPGAPAPTPKSRPAACDAIAEENEKALNDVGRIEDVGGGGFDPSGLLDLCVGDERVGAFAIEIVKASMNSAHDEARVRYRLSYTAPDGKRVIGPSATYVAYAYENVDSPMAPVLFDYDGDGQVEVALGRWHTDHAGSSKEKYDVFSVKSGKLVPFSKGSLIVDRTMDFDDDGRPDLFVNFHEKGAYSTIFAVHVLDDYRVSFVDDTAIGAMTEHCPVAMGKGMQSPPWFATVACKACKDCSSSAGTP